MRKLGERICVMGGSGSGKSTFAAALGAKTGYPVLHLDQIAFIPNTDWVRVPDDEIRKKHDAFIQKDKWIIDGQYSRFMPSRLARADTVVWIRISRIRRLAQYLMRCLRAERRVGGLDGATSQFSFGMVNWILFAQPRRNKKRMETISQYPHLNVITARSFKDLNRLLKGI